MHPFDLAVLEALRKANRDSYRLFLDQFWICFRFPVAEENASREINHFIRSFMNIYRVASLSHAE